MLTSLSLLIVSGYFNALLCVSLHILTRIYVYCLNLTRYYLDWFELSETAVQEAWMKPLVRQIQGLVLAPALVTYWEGAWVSKQPDQELEQAISPSVKIWPRPD